MITNQTDGIYHYGKPGERECGDCDVCCFIGAVPELEPGLNKPPHTPCKHQCGGCAIHDQKRPGVCVDFQCAWLRGVGDEDQRPDKSGVLCAVSALDGRRPWGVVIETREGGLEDGEQIIMDLVRTLDFPVFLTGHESKPPNDLVNYAVIKDDLLPRCDKLSGDLVEMMSKDIGMYELA